MSVGMREKKRSLGASCRLTRLLMGSGHSEKDRGGVRGFPRSRLPNGEAGGIAVGPDTGEA